MSVVLIVSGIVMPLLIILSWSKTRRCPRCQTLLPSFRRPVNRRQVVLGGWTCQNCGAEITAQGACLHDAMDGD